MPAAFAIICVQKDNLKLYLLLQRGPTARYEPSKFSMPGGVCRPNEKARDTVIREIREETDIDISNNVRPINIPNAQAHYFLSLFSQEPPVRLCWENINFAWYTFPEILVMHKQGLLTKKPNIPSKIQASVALCY